jgi:hypothetical protein
MARREKDVDMPRRGNFKGGMGQTSTTGGAKPKKTRGVATTEAVKKMKQKESSMAKPRAKPAKKDPIGMGAKPKTAPLKQRVNRGIKENQNLGGVRGRAGRRQRWQVNRFGKTSKLR